MLKEIERAMAKANKDKFDAEIGVRYYNYDHDILRNRIFYINNENKLVEDLHASNVKIPHTFFTELVDQKVQYLLSLPVRLEVEDVEFKEYLDEYYNDDLQLFLQEMVEGASVKGFEYAYARTGSDDKLTFQVSDYLNTFTMYDEKGVPLRVVRSYNRMKDDEVITHVEAWDAEDVTYMVADKAGKLSYDNTREINPAPHVLAVGHDGTKMGRTIGTIPFFKLANSRNGKTDLEPIKGLIDDYDIMACYLSNNLQDFAEAIYVVKGFRGTDLDELRTNIKAKKTMNVSNDGGLDIKTVDIPVEARRAKLDIDKTAIYKFGMGFDSSQIASAQGSVTNVAIQAGYELLNMKCNKAEIRLRTLLAWMNRLIVDDINRRYGKSYDTSGIKVIMERETMTDKKEIAETEKIEADTALVILQGILSVAPRLDNGTVLKMICEQFNLDFEEVQKLIAEQDYIPLDDGDDGNAEA